ncbi:MAG TPA: hypothetical protein VL357_07890 [Rariglobus sp.]|jgi:hypothetical protein|nr:hypothetical protein [Rariglobus sp.]
MALALFSDQHVDIPHPRVDESVLLVLEDAIHAAWEMLRLTPPATLNLATDVEETINFHLHEALADRVWNRGVVEGFDEIFFRDIQPAPEVCNYARTKLKYRPDMLVKLTGRPDTVKPSQDGIFIECKPVDEDHLLAGQYCKRGITRFVLGRYAWAMQEALMVGYTRDALDAVVLLQTAFGKTSSTVLPVGDPVLCKKARTTIVSRHRRRFNYEQTGAPAPEIMLRHVWLQRN